MRQKSLVVCLSGEGWERLSLAPRLRADETLSSWMERFAGAYALKVREFAEWLRYRPLHCVYAAWRLDLDVSPPADFAVRLAQLTGLCAREIEAHRLAASGMLVPHLRRTFCPQCWAEEGPYRRREWASAWSLVCPRHRRLLSEKPLPTPLSHATTKNPGPSSIKQRICGRSRNPPGKASAGGEFARPWESSPGRSSYAHGPGCWSCQERRPRPLVRQGCKVHRRRCQRVGHPAVVPWAGTSRPTISGSNAT